MHIDSYSFGRIRVDRIDYTEEVIVEKTGRAVETFNQLVAEGRDVAAALHLTC